MRIGPLFARQLADEKAGRLVVKPKARAPRDTLAPPPLAMLVAQPCGEDRARALAPDRRLVLAREWLLGQQASPEAASPVRLVYSPEPGMLKRLTFPSRIREVAAAHGLTAAEVTSLQRRAEVMAARHELYWLGAVEHGLSLPQIGRTMKRDHTSVLHGVRSVNATFLRVFGLEGAAALAVSPVERREAIVRSKPSWVRASLWLKRMDGMA